MAVNPEKFVYSNTQTPYMDTYKTWANQQKKQRQADIAQMNKNREADVAKSNASYESAGRQNYINYMQAQKRLPDELNSMGIRGGASESSLIRLGTNYGSNVAANNQARISAENDIRNAYAQQLADYQRTYRERLSDAQKTARENQLTWEQHQVERDLEQFSSVIEGLYKSKKGYQKLIKRLKASNDPNKKMKIMLARRAMNMLGGNGGSGGGGGGSRYGGGGGYGGYGSGGDGDGGDTTTTTTDPLTEYWKKNANKAATYKNTKTTTGKKSSTWKKYGTSNNGGRWVG